VPPDVLVVIPTYDEAANVARVVRAVRDRGVAVLVVDDDSPDGTGALADALATADPAVAVLHRPVRQGLGRAYADGFTTALATGASIICQMDADLSHDPAELEGLITAVRGGADVAIGSRYAPGGAVGGWSLMRRLVSHAGNFYARSALALPVRDATSGFRAHRADALRTLDAASCHAAGYAFQVEMTHRAVQGGLRVVEVPIHFSERRAGTSKMTPAIAIEAARLVTRWGLARIWRRLRSGTR
jgi:dolichol-phosphate mannosyltransferase